MVDIKGVCEADIEIFHACDTDSQPTLWLAFVARSTRPGRSSPRPLKQRLQELINAVPLMMKRAYESAYLQYQADLLAWNDGKNPKMATKPVPPVKPVEDFYDVPLVTRVEWLQYGDFDEAGIDLLEVYYGSPSDFMNPDAHLQVE